MNKDILLAKWLNNDISIKELEELKASPAYTSYMKIAEVTTQFTTPDFDSESNFEAISNRLKNEKEVKVVKLNPYANFLKIAAVFAVVFASYLYVDSLGTTFETQVAEKETFFLPDHSEVVLNANSEINFNEKNWSNYRVLSLKGEAYFKVSKGSKFSVNTNNGVVEVLGTQFNVYNRENSFYINCFEGLVSVSYNDTIIELPAGHQLKVEEGQFISHSNINSDSPAWTTNESNFENVTLALVLKEIESQYPVKITTKNININKRFSGTLTHNNLNLALKSICDPLNLAFTINGKEDVILYAKGSK
ncbi:MAG: transmembrane sensor [Flavobacteriaceae bacterium]|jgi:transmembrane sensor|uniref:FecR family protein n=1 Tax=Candidatus Marifrigoribacter sp. Uisw_064 TaxID=3230970 RepID=UPI003AE3CDD3